MARKKSKKLTIHSTETRIFMGLVLFVTGLMIIVAPYNQEQIFLRITSLFGVPSLIWGVTVLLLSIRILKGPNRFTNWKTITGSALLALIINIFLVSLIPDEELLIRQDFSNSGGQIGRLFHNRLNSMFGDFIEFVILLIVLLLAFSLVSNTSFDKIIDKIEDIIKALISKLSNFKLGSRNKEDKKDKKQSKDEDISIVDSTPEDEEDEKKMKEESLDIDDSTPKQKTEEASIEKEIEKATDKEFVKDVKKEMKKSSSDDEEDDKGTLTELKFPDWEFPPSSLLAKPNIKPQDAEQHKRNASVIEKTLESFNIESRISKITIGPTVVQYALSITVGTKVAKVRNLSNDIALALATPESQIRIEAPIPGTSLIGIEIPNPTPNFVYIKELVEKLKEDKDEYKLPIVLGKNVAGKPVIQDLSSLPHLLVAGATGTGKSVGINSMLTGLLMTKTPDELKLILVDPKMVEMAPYNGIPHLLTPVITDMELVVNALQWAVEEMQKRYRILKQVGARNISEYNKKTGELKMPYIVIVIDEMADLMLTTGVDVESKIVRLAQMARAVGIHLILATQRPSVDVITGIIKANIPGRVAFSVSTAVDSRVIIDQSGAETLIGKGDMMFRSPQTGRPIRLQGAWTDTSDTEAVIDFIKEQIEDKPDYSKEVIKPHDEEAKLLENNDGLSEDEKFEEALNVVINSQKASASMLQRRLRVGYNRAARLIEDMHKAGVVGPQNGSKPRDVLVSSVDQVLGSDDDSSQTPEDEFLSESDE